MNPTSPLPRATRVLIPILLVAAAFSARAAAPVRAPRFDDVIAESGTTSPYMLHADLWLGIDQRAKLDTLVFVLDNGARTCKVLNRDSTWAVDYTWIYTHTVLPERWYDPREMIRVGDSLRVADDAVPEFTLGTLRVGVRAGSLAQATSEAYRLWPTEIPPALRGRLNLKIERAKKARMGIKDTEPTFDKH